jgi:hypothetical protein
MRTTALWIVAMLSLGGSLAGCVADNGGSAYGVPVESGYGAPPVYGQAYGAPPPASSNTAPNYGAAEIGSGWGGPWIER